MKKPTALLVVLTCVFAAFLAGFHAGRAQNRSPVHIYQAVSTAPETQAPTEETGPVVIWPLNINTVTAEELELLPGIGPVLAQRIVDYRNSHGGYRAVEELLQVKGIGDSRLKDILDLITVETGGNT